MRYALRLLALACTTVCAAFSLLLLIFIPPEYIENYKQYHFFPTYRVASDIKHLAPFIVGFVCFGILYFKLARPRKNAS
jgi:hypothetical protein